MKFTTLGVDYLSVNENNLKDESLFTREKIHLIKMDLIKPTKEAIEVIVSLFPNTNRYVIMSNSPIKIYNDTFKNLSKKYYVENARYSKLVSFFRKNNKILLNICNLAPYEKKFVLQPEVLTDILWNCEVIQMSKVDYENVKKVFDTWNGNLIII